MIRHIEFCLEEIECEIDAQSIAGISEAGRLSLQRHIAQMRAVLADWQATAETMAQSNDRGGDKLVWIRGIDQDAVALLAAKGVTSFQTIAQWRHAEISALGGETLSLERIAEQNWIEQAAILATGQLTLYAKQIELASIADVEIVAAALPDTAMPIEAAPIATVEAQTVALPQAEAIAAALEPASTTAVASKPATARDNIVALVPAKRTSIGRRIVQAAAALAIIAAGIGALNGWDIPSVIAITAALAEPTLFY